MEKQTKNITGEGLQVLDLSEGIFRNEKGQFIKGNIPNKKLNVNKDYIIHLYKNELKSSEKIAKLLKASPGFVLNVLNSNGVKIRSYKKEINSDKLKELYFDKEKSLKECANYFSCCETSIRNRLKEYGIKTRTISEARKGKPWNNPELRKKSEKLKSNEKEIIRLYIDENKSIENISKIMGAGHETIRQLLIKNNINTSLKGRKWKEEHRINISKNHKGMLGKNHSLKTKMIFSKIRLGEKNPAWIDGRSFEPYPINFNKPFKRAIRKRDNHICLKCGKHQEKLSRTLDIHHIDYIKENTFEQNCCALCQRCNLEVNQNRTSWTKFFQSLLSERYGYEYTSDGEIVIKIEEKRNEK